MLRFSHAYDWENRRLIQAAEEIGMTQKQLNDYVNDPQRTHRLFELQNARDNMGHRFEKPGNGELDDIIKDMRNFLDEK